MLGTPVSGLFGIIVMNFNRSHKLERSSGYYLMNDNIWVSLL
jgi:hypothetical protein